MSNELKTAPHRQREHAVDVLFPERWSERAMNGKTLAQETLQTLLEAARWAPSSGNGQPWRFCYALQDSVAWPDYLNLLSPNNQGWCKNAGALVVMASKNTSENGALARTHSFDTGSAWMSLALQGSLLGLVVHGMAGFDYEKAAQLIRLPANHTVEAMCAIGYHALVETLPEKLREREKASTRKQQAEFAFAGAFPDPEPQGSPA